MIEDFKKLIKPYYRRIMMTVARAVIRRVNDTTKLQSEQITLMAGETRSDIERFQEYGLTSVPHEGAEAVVVFPGGNREHGLIIAVDDRRYRLKGLADGEVALYTDEGDKIHFKRGNIINIVTETLDVDVTTLDIDATTVTIDCTDMTINCTNNLAMIATNALTMNGATITATATTTMAFNCATLNAVASTGINFTTPAVTCSGALSAASISTTGSGAIAAGGNVSDSAGSMASIRGTYNSHKHPENDSGGPTDVPNEQM